MGTDHSNWLRISKDDTNRRQRELSSLQSVMQSRPLPVARESSKIVTSQCIPRDITCNVQQGIRGNGSKRRELLNSVLRFVSRRTVQSSLVSIPSQTRCPRHVAASPLLAGNHKTGTNFTVCQWPVASTRLVVAYLKVCRYYF